MPNKISKLEMKRLEFAAAAARAKYEAVSQIWHHVRAEVDEASRDWHQAVARRDAAKKALQPTRRVRKTTKP